MKSAWHIGAQYLPEQELEIEGGPQVITAGTRYLHHGTAALSWMRAVRTAMLAAGVTGGAVILQRDRKVRIYANANFELVWPADNALRNLLGFTEDLDGTQNSYVADLISPLLWSPGRTESPTMAPLGMLGHRVIPTYTAVSAYDGSTVAVSHGTGRIYNEFWFRNVPAARYQTVSALGGEWSTFFERVCAPAYSFNIWRNVDESDASDSVAVFSDSIGPYVYSPDRRGSDWTFQRENDGNFKYTDRQFGLTYKCHVVPEYPEP